MDLRFADAAIATGHFMRLADLALAASHLPLDGLHVIADKNDHRIPKCIPIYRVMQLIYEITNVIPFVAMQARERRDGERCECPARSSWIAA